MSKALIFLAILAAAALPARAQNITGDWQGTLKVGTVGLHLVLHIKREKDGALKADFDSVDQNAYGIPITSIELKGTKLTFSADSIHSSYEGTIAPDGKSIKGTWTQGRPLPLDFTRMAKPTQPVKPSDIDGEWLGTLQAGAKKLRVVFRIFNTELGLRASFASIDQSPQRIPVSTVARKGPHITMEVQAIGGKFEGTINSDHTEMHGTWTQGSASLPLDLKLTKNASELQPPPRPQNPKGPLPYQQKNVTFKNKAAGIRLAGTITIPPGKGPFPAVVLIAGSGPNNRDETVDGHKPFLVLADYLTRRKIVVLRYDKRGVGQSGGSEATATTADFAADAEAAFEFLRKQPEVNPREVGLIGHSEGGEIAPMVAARDRRVAFIVTMAGPGVPGDQILVEQVFAISKAQGMSPAQAKKNADQEREIIALAEKYTSASELDQALKTKLHVQNPHLTPAMLGNTSKVFESPWMRYFLRYNPAPTLEKVKCPVLALIGSKDTQVPAAQNLPAIRKALLAGGNKNFEVDEMPGLNHLFQPAKTGAPSEYYKIPTTISPVALKKISGWILKQTAR